MKKMIKMLAMLALIVCLVSSLFTINAGAAYTFSFPLDQTVDTTEVFTAESDIISCKLDDGRLPNGVSLKFEGTKVYIYGKPTESGEFNSFFNMETDDNVISSFQVSITIVAPTATPTATPKPTTKPTATPKPTAAAAPKITKHPTGETVEQGGTAKFIARADNADEWVWRIVSADTTNTVQAKDAPDYFSGVKVSGLDSEMLVLSNIPKSMNGWRVECKFTGDGGTAFTNGAVIRVANATNTNNTTNNNTTNNTNNNTTTNNNNNTTGTVKAATITDQPKGVETELGKDCTLSVAASSPDGGKLTYQWYSSTTDSRANIVSISGATSSSFTPPQTEGTVYYCAAIINNKDNKQSAATYSQLVAVRYNTASATPTPTASPALSMSPMQPAATDAANNNTNDPGSDRYSFSASLIFFGITGVIAIVAMVVIIIYIKRSGKDEE